MSIMTNHRVKKAARETRMVLRRSKIGTRREEGDHKVLSQEKTHPRDVIS